MSNVLVKGLDDTSELKCPVCVSWIVHWRKLKGLNADAYVSCSHPDCIKEATLGAHVEKDRAASKNPVNKTDFKKYIIPMCEEHNIQSGETILIDSDLLASATPCPVPRR
ncbi:hypothetical protein FACS189476_00030 [Spirochaetia bacterium]|nr:hypothetical protein FACS189476_00030 [Spirochaetia bacterium]